MFSTKIPSFLVNKEEITKRYDRENYLHNLFDNFKPVIDDPLGEKRDTWFREIEEYFDHFLKDDKIHKIIYETTQESLKDNIRNDPKFSNDSTVEFCENIIDKIGKDVFEKIN